MKNIRQLSARQPCPVPHNTSPPCPRLARFLPILTLVLVASHTAWGSGYWIAREGNRKWWSIAASADGTRLVAVTSWYLNGGGEVYTSADGGDIWTYRFTIPSSTPLSASTYVASSSTGAKLVACGGGTQIYTSTDYGVNWSPHDIARSWSCVASSADGTKLVAGVWGGYLYTSSNSGVGWSSCGSSSDWYDVASSSDGTKLLAVENDGYAYTSTNSGAMWTTRYPHPYRRTYFCAASSGDGTKLVVGEYAGDLYVSLTSGETWTARTFDGAWRSVAVSSLDGSRRLAATYGGPIYDISGINTAISPTWEHWTDIAMSADGTRVFGVVYDGQIWAYFDDGTPGVTVAATDATAGEPATGQGGGTFTFTRIGSTASALTANYTVSGTATSGVDYTNLGTTVTFAAGSSTATRTVGVKDDALTEGDETVVLTLAAGTGYRVAVPSSATVTIKDDEHTKHWTGTYSGYWGVTGNWLENAVPVNGDELVFPTATRYILTNNIAGLQLDRITFTKGGYDVKGNGVTVTNGITSAPPAAEENDLEFDLTCGGPQTFRCDAGTLGIYSANISLGAYTLTVTNATGTRVYIGGWAGVGRISGTGGVTKEGLGTLEFGGWSVANTYSGPTYVKEGVLLLDRTSVPSIAGPGALTIGDVAGAAGTAVVRYNANDNQIGSAPVVINNSGLLELSGRSDDFGNITLNGGNITLGTGTLTLAGNVSVTSSSSVINGPSGAVSFSGTVTFDIASSVFFDLQAPTAGSGPLNKAGAGTMRLGYPGTYSGLTTVQAGILDAWNVQSLGGTANGTRVNSGATLLVYADTTYTGEALFLNGTGFPGYGALHVIYSGVNSWTGPVTLESDATIQVYDAAATFQFSGVVSGGGGLTKIGGGTLTLGGTAANTYAGTTVVNGGTLVLSKSASVKSVPGNLVIGDGTGSDAVRLASNNQIALTADVSIQGGGLLECDAYYARINTLRGSGAVNFGTGGWLSVGDSNGTSTFDGTMTGIGYSSGYTLGKTGSGTLTLNGNLTFSAGITYVFSPGKLVVNGSISSAVTMDYGATLGGGGTVGVINNNGTVSPGTSAGKLNSGNVTCGSASSLAIELNGTTVGSGYDQLNTVGTVNLSGAALSPLTVGFLPKQGDQFIIVNNDGTDAVTGTFDGLSEGAMVSDSTSKFSFRVSYIGGSGNDVVLTMTNTFLKAGTAVVWSGNGNGVVETNECNLLSLVLTNTSAAAVNGLTATLRSLTPGVVVVQPYSTYPNLPASSSRTNDAFFQITTQPGFTGGTSVGLEMEVVTTTHGTLKVPFSLPSGVAPGSGICELCPTLTLNGSLGATSPQQTGRLIRDGTTATCALPKSCPGMNDSTARSYNAHTFRNGPSAACITVSLTGSLGDDVFSAAYLGGFNPANLCASYLADNGSSTGGSITPRVYSFNVAANQAFVVTVNEVTASAGGEYTLSVTGGNCRPALNVARADPSKVRLDWTTAAPGYHLEGTNRLNGVPWVMIPPYPPVVVNGKFTVSNAMDSIKFYRLHKP